MEMVAVSKMRRAQERMRASRPYATRIRSVLSHVASGRLEYKHPFLIERPVKNVGFIVIATDRGLCGSLNANLFRTMVPVMQEYEKQGVSIDICAIGRKAEIFFRRLGGHVVASLSGLGDKPSVTDVIGTVRVMLDAYLDQRIDRLYLVYNDFVNTMTQKPRVNLLVPILDTESKSKAHRWDYIYEPEAKPLIDMLLTRYIESLVYEGLVENVASEQAARMVAMKNASDNAGDILNALQIVYNKARQAAITRELSEIVAGAAAV